ncbi:SGNH/GDSL hydrolase family protein [Lignipirellula cremea]|uniref:SGNH/GDSL hydrolase family protein n=1 Tax=Lignipirellula cremea TaxID=2528010 RepID=UPI00119E1BA9|nr:SGNH/GDSL hydrolase family protein [Lignipirellula cremea]
MNRYLLIVCLLLPGTVSAADALPRVLILGDSIYNEPSRKVASELKERASVVWKNPGDTATALAQLDTLLGEEPWDVIHFNFGLADLHYRDPRTQAIRALSKRAGGVRVTSPEDYEARLDELAERLGKSSAKRIWASTTPILRPKPESLYDIGSEIEYNSIAARVMAKHRITVNDLHAFVGRQIDQQKPPEMFDFRGIDLHLPILKAIQAELDKR